MEQTERRKRVKWYKCPDCGYEWKSYGYQKRVFCPKCYETRTGKKLGASPETLAKARAARTAKREEREEKVNQEINQEIQVKEIAEEKPKQTRLERILNAKIF